MFQLLESGYRMECPPGCPARVYSLMRECWHWDDGRRPSFRQIHHDMEHMFQVSLYLQRCSNPCTNVVMMFCR